jgi:glyoxylase-like metal-dependent hydrolase (beta-lactamase superfamily II)
MPLSRREFSTLSLSAAALAALGPAARVFARRREAAGGLFSWVDVPGGKVTMEQGGNALVLSAGRFSVLVDCKNPGLGATLRLEAEALGAPIGLVINTHHHGDHSGGNPAFTKDRPLIAHARATPRLLAQAEEMLGRVQRVRKGLEEGDPRAPQAVIDEVKAFEDSIGSLPGDAFAPTRTVGDGTTTEVFGGIEMHLHHVGAGHTDNDLIVHVPSLNLIHTGDLLFHRRWCFIDRPAGATTVGWQSSLRAALALCDEKTVVIPGHGEITDRSGIQGQIDFFDRLREAVRHAKDVEGMTREEVEKLQVGAFADYGFAQFSGRALGAVFDELSGS